MVYSRRPSIQDSLPRKTAWRLPGLLKHWIIVPFGEYYACSRVSATDGYMDGFWFFLLGFVLVIAFGNRNDSLSRLRKLDEKTVRLPVPKTAANCRDS